MEACGSQRQPSVKTDYKPIPLRILRTREVADFDIYLRPDAGGPCILYREQDVCFEEEDQARLEESGVETVYVRAAEERLYRRYIERNLVSILDDADVQNEEKAELLYGSLVWLTEDVMADPRAGDIVPRSRSMVQNTCKFLYEQRDFLQYLMRVTSYDYYTYTHSVNVFVFTMALGRRVFPKERVKNEFGVGALLHDIGKSMVDPAIINCTGKLSPEQLVIMRKHPIYSHEILAEKKDIHPVSLDMARHHHERIDGDGYPDGLRGDDVSPEVRVLTIADVFDALTTRRPYRQSMTTFPALQLMRDEMAGHIDPEFFRMFVEMMGEPDA